MRIVAPGKGLQTANGVQLLDDEGRNIAESINAYKIEIRIEPGEFCTAVVYCYVRQLDLEVAEFRVETPDPDPGKRCVVGGNLFTRDCGAYDPFGDPGE